MLLMMRFWSCCCCCCSIRSELQGCMTAGGAEGQQRTSAGAWTTMNECVCCAEWVRVLSHLRRPFFIACRRRNRCTGGRLNTHKEAIRLQTKYTYVAVVSTNTIVHGSRNKQNTRGKTVERKEKNLKLYETSQSGGKSEFRGWTLLLLLDLCYTWIYTDINFFYR